jgi:hypothetical protein
MCAAVISAAETVFPILYELAGQLLTKRKTVLLLHT